MPVGDVLFHATASHDTLKRGGCETRASSFPREWIRSELINIYKNHDSYYKGSEFTHDMNIKRLGINPLVKRCGINPALWFLVVLIIMGKLVLEPK
jgi:hypothetical protein